MTALVLAAVAHAAGSQQHSDVRVDPATGNTCFVELDALFPWPDKSSDEQRTGTPR